MKEAHRIFGLIWLIGVLVGELRAQWVQTDHIVGVQISNLVVNGPNLFAGTIGKGVFLSSNSGMTWIAVGVGQIDTNVQCLLVKGNQLFAGTLGGGIFLSTNSGTTWIPVNSGLSYRRVVCLAATNSSIFAGTVQGGAFRSTDNGTSWTALELGMSQAYVSAFTVSGTHVFVGVAFRGVFYSSDDGTTWGATQTNPSYLGITCMASVGHYILVGTNNGMFVSADSGTTWSASNSGLSYTDVNRIATSGTNAFVGTWGDGVYLSTNVGQAWNAVNVGLPTGVLVSSLVADSDELFLGTYDGGWRRPLSEMVTSVNEENREPTRVFTLEQNYPNPFNPSTIISYAVPRISNVSLKLYNAIGMECATLDQGEKPPGNYAVQFYAADYPSGVYFYRLQTNGFVQTRKLLLLK